MKTNKLKEFICIAGFGYSGSGAVIDILKEFNGNYIFEKEFRIIKDPDGIIDLENALVCNWQEMKVDIAIRRFKYLINITGRKQGLITGIGYNYDEIINKRFLKYANIYINNLIDIQWNGDWPYHLHELNGIELFMYRLKSRIGINPSKNDKMYFSYPNDLFYEETKNFFENLFKDQKLNKIILDQALPPYCPQKYFNFFHNVKIIVIDRDPRDIFIELSRFPSYPTNPVYNFISYFKSQREAVERSTDIHQILDIKFENLITNYNTELDRICDFLEINKSLHIDKKQFFDPTQSAKNVGLWKQMKDNEEIKLIEKELKDYLNPI